MEQKRRKTKLRSIVATFGVASSTLYMSPNLSADIIDLTFEGESTIENPFFPNTSQPPVSIGIDQLSSAAWWQWNDTFGGTGRTQLFRSFMMSSGPLSVAIVQFGDVIVPDTFSGLMGCIGFGCDTTRGVGQYTEFDGTGSAFIACRPRISPSNLFWFRIDFTSGGPIRHACGQYGDEGESLVVGDNCKELYLCDHIPGDVDGNGFVNLLDVGPFVESITDRYVCEADINQDGTVDLLDVEPFVQILTDN